MLVAQSHLTLCKPMGCSLPGSSVHGILKARILEWGSHFLLQGIFLTQESNLGLLHDRRILYHLSHQGSPDPHPVHSPQPNPLNIIPCSENGNLSLLLAQVMASEVIHPPLSPTLHIQINLLSRKLTTSHHLCSCFLGPSIVLGQVLGGGCFSPCPSGVLPAQGGYMILTLCDSDPGAPLSKLFRGSGLGSGPSPFPSQLLLISFLPLLQQP